MSLLTLDTLKYMMKEEILEHYGNHEQIDYINKLLNSLLIDIKFNMDINDYTKQRGYYILEHI